MALDHRNREIKDPHRRDPNNRPSVVNQPTPGIVPVRIIKADIRIGRD